ncbi:HDOD domain-containing protein [Candidatus Binatia bacterium]|jgi:putative nucleotidyltransferase with HDIG domain|nr:HDOD domain-containing protein [Candidatus Binatia bacterium]
MSEQAALRTIAPEPRREPADGGVGARRTPEDGGASRPLALGDTLPSAPHVVSRLVSLGDGDADTSDLLATIDRDPALTARILRTANSPFFAQTRSVTSVTRAVVVLGLPMVRNLTLGLTVWDATSTHLAPQQARRLWEHSLAVAHAAQHFAARTQAGAARDAFTAGLLHDVGKLVLARQFPDAYRQVLAQATATPLRPELERAAVGHDHAAVGALLFERWRLPALLIDAVARHHDLPFAPDLAGVVGAANVLVGCAPGADDEALATAATAGVTAELWQQVQDRGRAEP